MGAAQARGYVQLNYLIGTFNMQLEADDTFYHPQDVHVHANRCTAFCNFLSLPHFREMDLCRCMQKQMYQA